MTLSWSLRLLCLLLVVAGVLHAALQFLLVRTAPLILRRIESTPARHRERILYLLQIGPFFLALFFAAGLCLPSYLLYESNHASENVSALCLTVAAIVGLWFAFALLRGSRITLRTLRFTRACRRSGQRLRLSGDTPVIALAHANHPLALLGFFKPVIVASSELLADGGFHHDALEVALDHERSHSLHHDNWKLLSLSFLPSIPGRSSWRQHWQTAADCAADDDAVRGDANRSLLLAEALVHAARAVRPASTRIACSALTSAEAGLAARIDRLVHPRPARASRPSRFPGLAALLLLPALAALAASPWLYALSESLLHLGRF